MPKYKGSALVFLRKQMQKQGQAFEKDFLNRMEKEAVLAYLSALSGSWVPLDLAEKIFVAGAEVLFPGDPEGFKKMGRERAKDNLTGIYKIILKVSSPRFVINQSARIWALYYDRGEVRVELAPDRNYAEMHVQNYPDLPYCFREITTGYIIGAVELTGAKNVQLHRDDSNPEDWKWYGTWE